MLFSAKNKEPPKEDNLQRTNSLSPYCPLFRGLRDSLPPFFSLSLLGPTHMGGRPATCAYWVDYTQAHVVQ